MPADSNFGRPRRAEVYLAGTLAGQTPDITLALAGCRSVDDLGRAALARVE